jgi:hypothetical protein
MNASKLDNNAQKPLNLKEQRIAARYFPKDATAVEYAAFAGVVYSHERAGAPYAMGYAGSAMKPSFNYRFRSEAHRAEYIAKWVEEMTGTATYKRSKQEEKRSSVHTLNTGDILYGTWGYDQTNVEYFQVVSVISDKTVEVRAIGHTVKETGFMSGDTMPIKDKFTSPVMRCRATGKRIASGKGRNCGAGFWDGKPIGATWYA